MRKYFLIMIIFIFAVLLFVWCSKNIINKGKEISSIEVIRISDKKKWTISKKDEIDVI